MYVIEGRFFMNLYKLTSSNDMRLLCFNEEQDLGANEENADQDGDANAKNADQDGDATDQDGDVTYQDGDANEENADQDGDAADQDADQDGDVSEENANQDGDANEENADQDGDATEQDLGANERPSSDYILCCRCSTRVALVEDYILIENDLVTAGFFNRLFDVVVSEDVHRVIDGKTLAETYCAQCTNLLGWKLIAGSQPSRNYREGFYMRLDELIYWNDVTLLDFLSGGNNDQDGGADEEQDHDQNGGANEENADHYADANEQAPNEQFLYKFKCLMSIMLIRMKMEALMNKFLIKM